MSLSFIMAPGRSYFRNGLHAQLPRACVVLDLWLSQANSLSVAHGTSLVVNSGLLLTCPIQLAPYEDRVHFQEGSSCLCLILEACPGLSSTGPWHQTLSSSQALFSLGNVRLLIIQMVVILNTEYRHSLSPLCHLLTHM